MNNIILSASILSADFDHLGNELRTASATDLDWIHIDVMDGQFVPNISMGPFIVETCNRITDLPLDVHLMIKLPERHIESFAQAGADWISVHHEGNPNIHRTLQEIRALGCHPGIVLNPGTPAAAIESVLDIVDLVLVMSVNPGFSGQKYMPAMAKKIAKINEMAKEINPSVIIQVDGGITADTICSAYDAGARSFVAATAIFKHPGGIAAGIESLRNAVKR
jgi:ribulose-phosphate 3-epimerase